MDGTSNELLYSRGLNKDVISMINNYRINTYCEIRWDLYYLNNEKKNEEARITKDGKYIAIRWCYEDASGVLFFDRSIISLKRNSVIPFFIYYLNKKKEHYLKGDELYEEINRIAPDNASYYINIIQAQRVIYHRNLKICLSFSGDGVPIFEYCTYDDYNLTYRTFTLTIPPFIYPQLIIVLESLFLSSKKD